MSKESIEADNLIIKWSKSEDIDEALINMNKHIIEQQTKIDKNDFNPDYGNNRKVIKGVINELADSISNLQAEIEKKDELIFAYDATRTPILDRTIINLQAEVKNLKKKYKGYTRGNWKYYHDVWCNADRNKPMGCPGCSCTTGKEIKQLREDTKCYEAIPNSSVYDGKRYRLQDNSVGYFWYVMELTYYDTMECNWILGSTHTQKVENAKLFCRAKAEIIAKILEEQRDEEGYTHGWDIVEVKEMEGCE